MLKNKFLFAFENEKYAVVETKLLDQPEGTPPNKVYFWLFIEKKSKRINLLDFVSMQKEPKQIRVFKQGHLEFDENKAIYNELELSVINNSDIDIHIKDLVSHYLNNII